MIRILYRDAQGEVNSNLQIDNLIEALKDTEGLLWLDITNEPDESVEPILADAFGFHPLAIDDALHESHVPKLDDWQQYLYIVLRAVCCEGDESEQFEILEQDIFLGPNYIVTYSQQPIAALERVWNLSQKDQRWLKRRADHLLYRLADEFVSDSVSFVEEIEVELDQIEVQIFSEISPAISERLSSLKRRILSLRRTVIPQRDVMAKLARTEYEVVDPSDLIFFRDVYDHLLRLDNLLNDLVILVGSARDSYLSIVNNRMNEIMKTLTVITAFFMPLAFITGFFGMNFFHSVSPFGVWTSSLAFVIVMAAMVLIPIIMFLWMRRRAYI
ncbi:MAG: magnesium/cobalt transporter CorA [Candidatus Promineifilaceae bacterium]|jgi:magnesium transporter